MGTAFTSAGSPSGDELDEVRDALQRGQTFFGAALVGRLLDRLGTAERRVHVLTRPEAVDFRTTPTGTYVVLRCRACQCEFLGPTQASFLAAPPAPCE